MNLLNKLTIKNLKLNKKRTIVTIIGIILSVALITAVASMYASGIKSLITYEKQIQGDCHVIYYDVPSKDIEIFKNNRKIEKINLVQNIGYAKINSNNNYKPYAYVKSFTKEALENLSINIVEGRLPQNENEIVIPTHLRTNGRLILNVGDDITLNIGRRVDNEGNTLNQNDPYLEQSDEETNQKLINEKLIDLNEKTYKIVGIIGRPASNIESYSAPGFTFVTYMNENKNDGNFDIYAKYTKQGRKDYEKVTAGLLNVDEKAFKKSINLDGVSEEEANKIFEQMEKAKYEFAVNGYLIGLETNPLTTSSVGGLGTVAIIIMGIIVFTSVFCIKNSFDISITEKIKQYGMLRSVGATRKQIKKNVFYEATILGLIGIPLGILLGFIASYILVIVSNYYLESSLTYDALNNGLKLQFVFSIIATLISILLGILTIYFSAFRSARRASKVSPIDSIRNSANIKIKAKKLKSPKIIKSIFGMGGVISFKNLKRNKKKYRTTVISIIVSVFVFIALSSFMTMAFDEVKREIKVSDYNISLSPSSFQLSKEATNKYLETTKLDNIKDYTILKSSNIEIKDIKYNKEYIKWTKLDTKDIEFESLTIYAIGDHQYKKYIKSLGLKYEDIKDKAILMDYSKVSRNVPDKNKIENKQMRIYDYKKGEKLSGKIGNDNLNLEIGYVTNKKPFGLTKDETDEYLIISDEMYDKIDYNKLSTMFDIYYKSTNANKLQDEIEEVLKGEEYNLNNIEENVRTMSNFFTLIGIFLYGFIIVITLIGITNIFNTITTNMELRKQEFAMLKSVGMTTKEFNRMIRLETLFMGLKSLFFGIPIGIGLSYIIYHYLQEESGAPYKLPILGIVIAILAVFILISMIMKYSMSKINKQNTIETIRNENI